MAGLIGHELGRYRMMEWLGEGGMATVYKAYDTCLETCVAVKVIRIENILPRILPRALKRIEPARLGAINEVDTGTRGTYHYDAFESRRRTYIGSWAGNEGECGCTYAHLSGPQTRMPA